MKINDFKVITSIKVQWGEMDAFKHVNNVSYVRWGETARIDYFLKVGLINSAADKSEYAPILGFQSVKYIAPLEYPDTVKIGTRVEEIKQDRIVFRSYYFSEKVKKLVSVMTHEVLIIDYKKGSKILVPITIIEKIKELEGNDHFLTANL